MSDTSAAPTPTSTPMYRAPNIISDDDHGAWVTVVAAILMSWMILTLLMRIVIRTRFNGPWGADDTTAAAGSTVAFAQTISIFVAVGQGFGRKTNLVPAQDQDSIARTIYASQILYIAAMCLSKVSTSLLIARLTRVRKHLIATWIVTAITSAWGIAAMLALALRCDLSQPWSVSNGAQCVSPFARWIGIESVDMLIELMLFGLAVFLVWGLQMSRKLKFIVVGAFLCRPLVIVVIAVRVYFVRPVYFNQDPLFNGVNIAILTQVCMHYALMAATIPCTKPFIKAFHSGYMDPEGYTAGSHAGTKNSGYGLQSAQSADGAGTRATLARDSQFNAAKNPSYRTSAMAGTVYPTSTRGLTSPDSRPSLVDDAPHTDHNRQEDLSLPGAVDAAFVAAQNADRPARIAPPVVSPRHNNDSAATAGLFRPDAGVVRTTIEHDPLRRDGSIPATGRRGQTSQENIGGGGLMIRQTREYEVSYEPV